MTPCVRRHANLKCPNFIYSHMWHTHFWYKIQVRLQFIVFFCAFLLPNVPDTFVTQPLGGPRIFVYQSPNNTTRHSPLAWILFRNHGFFFMTKTRTWFCSKIRYLTHLVISPTTRYVVINTVCNVSNMFSKLFTSFQPPPRQPHKGVLYIPFQPRFGKRQLSNLWPINTRVPDGEKKRTWRKIFPHRTRMFYVLYIYNLAWILRVKTLQIVKATSDIFRRWDGYMYLSLI